MKGPNELSSESQQNAGEEENMNLVHDMAGNNQDILHPENEPVDLDLIMQAIEAEQDDKENVGSASSLPAHLILPGNFDTKDGEIRVYESTPSTSNPETQPPLVYVYHCENKTFLVICKVI